MINAKIIVYGMAWHIHRSDAFRDLLIDPIQPYANIDLQSWDGVSPIRIDPTKTYIFCQIEPAPTLLEKIPDRVIWIPMWDNVQHCSQTWWNRLPKTLRIVAFSEAVYQRATTAGLNTLRLHYHKNPAEFEPVTWHQGRVLLYWNRMGLVGPNFLERLCKDLQIDKLLFRPQADPGYAHLMTYQLPRQLGNTIVETLPVFTSREEYLAATHEANVLLAPRKAEGVGMVFLEAMARGNAVFAYDGSTMNEYIVSGNNGYLLKSPTGISRIAGGIGRQLAAHGIFPAYTLNFPVKETSQDWEHISSLDLDRLRQNARASMALGYTQWQSEIATYTRFLLDD